MDSILDFLEHENADVVMLQEVLGSDDSTLPSHYRSLETLQQRLHYPHQDFAPSTYDKFLWGTMPNGNAVLSRFPISSRAVTPLYGEPNIDNPRDPFDPKYYPMIPRNLQHVALDTPAGEVNVFNLQGVWDLDGDNVSPQRQKMSDVILRETEGRSRVIIAGDTNAKHTNPVMRAIEQRYTNVFGDELSTSFNMRRKDNPGYASAVVDMIYISDDLKLVDKSCPDVDVSDHLPLITTIKVQ